MNKYLLYLLLLIAISSCKPLGKIANREERNLLADVIEKKVTNRKSEYFLCDRADIQIGDEGTKTLHAKFFITTGKSIFISLSYFLGIEIGRAQITHDSIKYINRVNREYYFGNIENLIKLTGINFGYEEIENILLKGIPLNEKDNKKKVLSRFTDTGTEYIYNFWFDPKKFVKVYFEKATLKEYKIELSDNVNGLYFVGSLSDYLSEPSYPGVIRASVIKGEKKTDIKIFINKIENKVFQNTSFKINNNYNELVF
jgi:hypothetical protein